MDSHLLLLILRAPFREIVCYCYGNAWETTQCVREKTMKSFSRMEMAEISIWPVKTQLFLKTIYNIELKETNNLYTLVMETGRKIFTLSPVHFENCSHAIIGKNTISFIRSFTAIKKKIT